MSFSRYPKYKDSTIEWLGEVPDHWKISRYKSVFHERDERSRDGSETLLSVSAYTGVTPRSEIIDTDDVPFRSESLLDYKVCHKNDLVMNIMLAWNRAQAFSIHKGIVSPAYCVFRLKGNDDPRFLHYLVRADETIGYFKAFSSGVIDSRLRLYPDVFGSLYIATPERLEQEAISSFLDHEAAKIDVLIREQQRLIELLKEKRQAVISHAVTRGLDSSVPTKDSGERWPGQIPHHWAAKPLKHLVSISSGSTPSKSKLGFWEGLIPWASPKDMKSEILYDTQDHVSQSAVSQRAAKILDQQCVIVVVRGMILAHSFPVAKNVVPITINQDLKAIECGVLVDPDFLVQFLIGSKDLLVSLAAESAHGTLKLESSILRNLIVSIPPKPEQIKIAAYLDRKKAALDDLVISCESAIALLQERKAALISASVTGKIDVRLPAKKTMGSAVSLDSQLARPVLAAEILNRCNGPRMGRIKLQKLAHLCEYHAQLDEIRGNYVRKPAGPFDSQMMRDIRSGLQKQEWFEEIQEDGRFKYQALEHCGEHKRYLECWTSKQDQLNLVFNLLGEATTKRCEIISTLYAAWNDLIIEGLKPDEAAILYESSSGQRWHKSKEKIQPESWQRELHWMKAHGLVPTGFGSHTIGAPAK